ncbi:hypothetical protein ACFQH8_13800 [Halomicroarcula sp. GCM10025710]
MGFDVRRRLSVADTVTLANAVVGFAAGAVAFTDLQLAARLMLVAIIFDAVDGIVAREGESGCRPAAGLHHRRHLLRCDAESVHLRRPDGNLRRRR